MECVRLFLLDATELSYSFRTIGCRSLLQKEVHTNEGHVSLLVVLCSFELHNHPVSWLLCPFLLDMSYYFLKSLGSNSMGCNCILASSMTSKCTFTRIGPHTHLPFSSTPSQCCSVRIAWCEVSTTFRFEG